MISNFTYRVSNVASFILLFALSSLPIAGGVRYYLFKEYACFYTALSNICKQDENKNRNCNYKWFVEFDKDSINTMKDSLIFKLHSDIINNLNRFPENQGTFFKCSRCVNYLIEIVGDSTIRHDCRNQVFQTFTNKTSMHSLTPFKNQPLQQFSGSDNSNDFVYNIGVGLQLS